MHACCEKEKEKKRRREEERGRKRGGEKKTSRLVLNYSNLRSTVTSIVAVVG